MGAADDPFRLTWLAEPEHRRLAEEASAIAMLGGRRVVRVRDVGDALADLIARVLADPGDSLIVLEAKALPGRSKLLTLLDAAPNAATLACYPETGTDLRGAIARGLKAAGVQADEDALTWLADHLGADYASTRREIDKLVLYAGELRRLDLDDVRACVGDQAATAMDDAAWAASTGRVALADISVERALAAGSNPVALLRTLLGHYTRLHQLRGRMDEGAGADQVVAGARPPVFWKRKEDMVQSLQRWPTARALATITEVRRAEQACKQTGAPDETIIRHLVLTLARQAARR